MAPHGVKALHNMSRRQIADELCQFIKFRGRLVNSSLNFHETSPPLAEFVGKADAKVRKGEFSALKLIALPKMPRMTVLGQASAKIHDILWNDAKLSHSKHGHEIRVLRDVSDKLWASIVTQSKKER